MTRDVELAGVRWRVTRVSAGLPNPLAAGFQGIQFDGPAGRRRRLGMLAHDLPFLAEFEKMPATELEQLLEQAEEA